MSAIHELSGLGIDVDTSARRLAEYSFDASNYQIRPIAVIFPRSAKEVARIARVCHRHDVALTARGGGTSMAGNAIGPGVILDFSRHMRALLEVDEESRTATVQAGMVLTHIQQQVQAATEKRLTFAPDPSSQSRATIGGCVANDACGNHSVRYGRTSDHVESLDIVTADGYLLTATDHGLIATTATDEAAIRKAQYLTSWLTALAADHLSEFRLELSRIPRQVSGFHLTHLLPEHGLNVARALVGSEGTCAIVVAAKIKLVPKPTTALLLCVGYLDVVEAARDVPTILEFTPAAVEGIDEAIVATMRHRRGVASVQGLPDGNAWLYIDLDGHDGVEVRRKAHLLLARLQFNGRMVDGRIVDDLTERASLWRVREDGAGLSARLVGGGESWPGWEDSAVAPENLADYLAEFRELLTKFHLTGIMYGHFGAGCMHVRIDFDLRSTTGVEIMHNFVRAAAYLVVKHGGSLSGEHGDGRARSELLPIMYSPTLLAAFERFKQIWDPTGILNPGNVVAPAAITDDLALLGVPERPWRTTFDLPLVNAVQACVGIGRCRSTEGGVMCPSYRATLDEKDSTRARARVLQDMVDGAATQAEGWRSKEVRESLDLCLSCKACATDCPVGVDMATYKSEFLSHYYHHRLRPLSHYSMGWLPLLLRVTTKIAPALNTMLKTPLRKAIAKLGGLTAHRKLPTFASAQDFPSDANADAILLVDSFTRGFRPHVAEAAKRVLNAAGHAVECEADACCGLTWISTGQLKQAKKVLTRAVATLDDGTDRPIVVVEPSCAAAFAKDLPELVDSNGARRVASRVRSFASHVTKLAEQGWQPAAVPTTVTVQSHCHEYSVFGATTQVSALKSVGVEQIAEATGCCGLAGNFGFEANHYDTSMQVAAHSLIPALDATDQATPILTDGFSCHMQVSQLGRTGQHLAEILDPAPKEQ